jgi:uncharacterized membrane protein
VHLLEVITEWIEGTATAIEVAGVAVTAAGSAFAVARTLLRPSPPQGRYKALREDVGRAILLGLELLVAADIIRTVSEDPTLEGVVVLALIVLVRTFLSFTLQLELDGRWPWQRAIPEAPPASSSRTRAADAEDRPAE